MAYYNLYAGVTGAFGGAVFQETAWFDTPEDADAEAMRLAIEEYETYSCHGFSSWEDIAIEVLMENGIIEDEDDYDFSYFNSDKLELMLEINERYDEYVFSNIDYYAEEADENAEDD